MTPTRAVADERREIVREIDRRIADLKNRTNYGFVALEEFRLWLLTRGEIDTEIGISTDQLGELFPKLFEPIPDSEKEGEE